VRLFEVGRTFSKDASVVDSETTTIGNRQTLMVGGIAFGSVFAEQWGQKGINARGVDFFDVKGDLEKLLAPLAIRTSAISDHPTFHPGRAANIEIALTASGKEEHWQKIGVIGELHPKLQQQLEFASAPILFEFEYEPAATLSMPAPVELSKFPAVKRDLALVMQSTVPAQEVLAALKLAALRANAPSLVTEIVLFDDFRPSAERPGGMNADERVSHSG
jgi:phenylalanyl-tRNA synthetase beta chain